MKKTKKHKKWARHAGDDRSGQFRQKMIFI